MKTVKKFLVAVVLMISMASFANADKVIVTEDGNVTILKEEQMVHVSVLNPSNNSYKLFIYDENDDVMFEGRLGSENSIGKMFDFNTAKKGNYTFKFVTKNGEVYSYNVKAGVRS